MIGSFGAAALSTMLLGGYVGGDNFYPHGGIGAGEVGDSLIPFGAANFVQVDAGTVNAQTINLGGVEVRRSVNAHNTMVNVVDYGATCGLTGGTNSGTVNATKIQAAINAAGAQGEVYVPPCPGGGYYALDNGGSGFALTVLSGQYIHGLGSWGGSNNPATFGCTLHARAGAVCIDTDGGGTGLRIENITVYSIDAVGYGIANYNGTSIVDLRLTNVTAENFNYNFFVNNGSFVTFEGVWAQTFGALVDEVFNNIQHLRIYGGGIASNCASATNDFGFRGANIIVAAGSGGLTDDVDISQVKFDEASAGCNVLDFQTVGVGSMITGVNVHDVHFWAAADPAATLEIGPASGSGSVFNAFNIHDNVFEKYNWQGDLACGYPGCAGGAPYYNAITITSGVGAGSDLNFHDLTVRNEDPQLGAHPIINDQSTGNAVSWWNVQGMENRVTHSGSSQFLGSVRVSKLATPGQPVFTPLLPQPINGSLHHATPYCYSVVAVAADGSMSAPSPQGCVTTASSPTADTYTVTAQWTPVPGAYAYYLFGNTAGSQLQLQGVTLPGSSHYFTDRGGNTWSGPAPTLNTTGGLAVNGPLTVNGNPLAPGSMSTTANTTLWVDPVNGIDSNTGLSSGVPLQHLQFAMDAIPTVVRHQYTINFRAGTAAETVLDNHFYASNSTFGAGITIFGFDLTTPSITGSTSGTLGTAPSSGATWNGSPGVNWTAHALKGMFVSLTSGGDSGRLYPIADNSTTTLDLPTYRTQLNGATFNIVTLSGTISVAGGGDMSVLASNSGDQSGLTIQRMNIQSSSFYGLYVNTGQATLTESWVDTGSFTGVFAFGSKSNVNLTRTYVNNNHGGNTGVTTNNAENVTFAAAVIDSGAYGVRDQGNGPVSQIGFGSSGHLIVQNTTTAGMYFTAGPLFMSSFQTTKPIIRNNTGVGVRLEGHSNILAQYWEVTGNTSHGIQYMSSDNTVSHNSLNCFNCTVSNNGGDGIRVESSHNALQLTSTTISSNTGVGVDLIQVAGFIPSSHNEVFLDTNCAMSSNGHDLSVDGTNFSTIANLRAQSGKFIIDASSLFNRLSAQ